MLFNYLKIAWRNLAKNKAYSFINIFGLSVGMAVALLIALWMHDEWSANKHHQNYETICQVMMHQTFDGHRGSQQALPYAIGEELKEKYPDFEAVAMCDWGGTHSLVAGDQKFLKKGHYIGDEAIGMFSLRILNGDKNPLKEPFSIVLTDETAHTIFGNQDPIGKSLRLDNSVDLKVTAVVAKQPKNATLQFDYLVPWVLGEKQNPEQVKNERAAWDSNSYQTFVQLKKNIGLAEADARTKDLVVSHFPAGSLMQTNLKPEVFLHPMAKWRLYSEFENGKNTGGFIKYVQLFGIFGLFILGIACINFMNLSTARSEKRAKEVGVRKAIGSGRKQLIAQFLSESLLIAALASVLALTIVSVSLPYFNDLTEKKMNLPFGNPVFGGSLLLFTLLTGLLAGSYPALYLSSFNPMKILKGSIRVGKSARMPRQVLVVFQFTFSIALMIGTFVIYQQIQHGKNRPIGFNSHGLLSVGTSKDLEKNFEPLRQELLASGMVSSVCKSNCPPSQIWSNRNGWEWRGSTPEDKGALFNCIATSYDYINTLGIQLRAGRDFSRDFGTDSSGVILNEAAAKRMGLENPVDEILKKDGKNLKVIGVIPDINMESPFQTIMPLTIVFDKDWVNFICLRINPQVSGASALEKIKPIFDRYNPSYPFDYAFADIEYAKKFNDEELIGNLSLIVSILAIFISCLGLFGLASFMAEQRTKEIGIRKVLGASVPNLWGLLSQGFVKLVVLACLIASPLAWYGMTHWLSDFEYRITVQAWVFAAAGAAAVAIVFLTVGFQSVRAALANPVKSLRSE